MPGRKRASPATTRTARVTKSPIPTTASTTAAATPGSTAPTATLTRAKTIETTSITATSAKYAMTTPQTTLRNKASARPIDGPSWGSRPSSRSFIWIISAVQTDTVAMIATGARMSAPMTAPLESPPVSDTTMTSAMGRAATIAVNM